MQHWNTWGDGSDVMTLSPDALSSIKDYLGSSRVLPDKSFACIQDNMLPSKLPRHPLVQSDALTRLRYSCGHSFPDWLARKTGLFMNFTDGVAKPGSRQEIRQLLDFAKQEKLNIIAYGGGTSVAGQVNPPLTNRANLTVSMENYASLMDFDPVSQLATFGAGVRGPRLEAALQEKGFTLGHFPQSFEWSTLGGWVATRSSGQQSLRYGRIEQLFAGGVLETFTDTYRIKTYPASAAGPDLKSIILGSEGRLGILSDITVNISPLPASEVFVAAFFPDWDAGLAAFRAMAEQRIDLSMMRLSNTEETRLQLQLSSKQSRITFLEALLGLKKIKEGKVLAMFGLSGDRKQVAFNCQLCRRMVSTYGGFYVGRSFDQQWRNNRFKLPLLREALWQQGYAVDTVETATVWSEVRSLAEKMEKALQQALKHEDEKVYVFTHLSHIYRQGSSIYTTFLFRVADTAEATLQRWKKLKQTVSQTIVDNEGTISHHHGVGQDHRPYMAKEKGEWGVELIKHICQYADPDEQLNPDNLVQ